MNTEQFFIGGRWVAPAGGGRIAVVDSYTEEPFASVAEGTEADIDAAVAAACSAAPGWAAETAEARAGYLRQSGSLKMLIQGNTDERGSREYNIALGQRRSEGVKRVLLLLGVREEQVEAVSLGEEKPKEAGHTEEAWTRNRRSDMLYTGEY